MAINRPDTFSPPADIGTAVVKNGGTSVASSLSGESEVEVTESLPSVTIGLSNSYHSFVYQSTLADTKSGDGGIYFNFTPFTQDLSAYSTKPLAFITSKYFKTVGLETSIRLESSVQEAPNSIFSKASNILDSTPVILIYSIDIGN